MRKNSKRLVKKNHPVLWYSLFGIESSPDWGALGTSQDIPRALIGSGIPRKRPTSVLFKQAAWRGKEFPATQCSSSQAEVIILPGGPPLWSGLLSIPNKLYHNTFIPTLVGNYGTLQSVHDTHRSTQTEHHGEIHLLSLHEGHPHSPRGPIQETSLASNWIVSSASSLESPFLPESRNAIATSQTQETNIRFQNHTHRATNFGINFFRTGFNRTRFFRDTLQKLPFKTSERFVTDRQRYSKE